MGLHIDFLDDAQTLDSVSIGDRIRALRKSRGLTQVQLSKRLKIDQSTLSDIERGASFSAAVLLALADELQTSPHYIMRDGSEEDLLQAELVVCFQALQPEGREALLRVARGLVATVGPSPANPFPSRAKNKA